MADFILRLHPAAQVVAVLMSGVVFMFALFLLYARATRGRRRTHNRDRGDND